MSFIYVPDESLEEIHVSKKNRIFNHSISKGNQQKWVKNNTYIKQNTWKWYESASEVLVSCLLQFSSIQNYVKYHECKIIEDNEEIGKGCYSHTFLKEGEKCISFYRIFKNMGCRLEDIGYEEAREIISDVTGFDIKPYLDACLCIDAITYNEDRHFNNLSVIKSYSGYREAPLYDNGLSCLSDVFTYPLENSLSDNLKKVYARPFDTDFIRQLSGRYIVPINIDVDGFLQSVTVHTEEEKRAFDVVKTGLKRTEGIAWERY